VLRVNFVEHFPTVGYLLFAFICSLQSDGLTDTR